jgi:hypothetical protein
MEYSLPVRTMELAKKTTSRVNLKFFDLEYNNIPSKTNSPRIK